jgi:plasmid stability protein
MSHRSTAHTDMRPLVIKHMPDSVQKLIRKRAWRKHISYEKAVIEFLTDAEIEDATQHDVAIVNEWFKDEEEYDEPFCRCCDEHRR